MGTFVCKPRGVERPSLIGAPIRRGRKPIRRAASLRGRVYYASAGSVPRHPSNVAKRVSVTLPHSLQSSFSPTSRILCEEHSIRSGQRQTQVRK